MRNFIQITITKKGENRARLGHPWVFEGEILKESEKPENGSLVDVVSEKGKYIGTGFYNDHSKIRVRILSYNANDRFDEAFFERRVRYAVEYRKTVMPGADFTCCRLIFGEADGFPGLTVDRFDDVLVAQVLSLGMERHKNLIFSLILRVLREMGERVKGVYERNDVKIRELEGMSENKGIAQIPENELTENDLMPVIFENGLSYAVDVVNGQKTGFFLDQKYNRQAVARIAKGKHVLDCFTHTGAFALNAACGGAASVTAVDISAEALKTARQNILRNQLTDVVKTQEANVFELLTELKEQGHAPYDFIILDPPAFTKSSSTVHSAFRGYKEINLKAMKLLPRGGYLATCSCSHFMDNTLFVKMLHEAARDAHVSLRQIEARQQAPDHPILYNVPETDYLKFYLFQVV
ncbi:MAG: class I SAM-dependent rRNA methyltransferase [Acidaminococcus sp.]|jgi:23S rRNA (cytosine1962-C5)-methyltransferase|uniref:Class I SAM-dependent rRNA methyltransferase n=1 Tax=Acidaminococcus intestini TaxID=187327 RepID=A0A943EIL0_9FIRM|nr:class I SAM-dependent rRNA methyltransferase [Acidaminococcus sp.]MBS5518955.1 class I SAM-dependent rRNA methyltransferase [Acidaminococcus intestini]MDY2739168.1 class I SAM-dependent rRNA methyltransferase [Acidaminococcus sp.]